MHTQLAEALTKTNSVRNDPATARESSKLVRPAKAPIGRLAATPSHRANVPQPKPDF